MVKKRTTRQKVKDKLNKKATIKEQDDSVSVKESGDDTRGANDFLPEHAKRRIAKQTRFYAKLQENLQALNATKSISKKKHRRKKNSAGETLNLSSLAEFLPTFTDEKPDSELFKKGATKCKNRQKLVTCETKQLENVLAHPAFSANPFAAIQQHLEILLAPQLNKQKEEKQDKKKKNKNGSKKRSKAASGVRIQAMEI